MCKMTTYMAIKLERLIKDLDCEQREMLLEFAESLAEPEEKTVSKSKIAHYLPGCSPEELEDNQPSYREAAGLSKQY